MEIKVYVDIDKREDEPELEASVTPINEDILVIELLPKEDHICKYMSRTHKPPYFMGLIIEMLDSLDDIDREWMIQKCESIRKDYSNIKRRK